MPQTDTPPYFNLELFLETAGETRLSGTEMEECISLWDTLARDMVRVTVTALGRDYLAVYLPEEAEEAIDEEWRTSPSSGFRKHALAQTLCMCAVHEAVPEVEDMGCAPSPIPSDELLAALAEVGLPARVSENALVAGRRYAVVTAATFRGGCETCALTGNCPRHTGGPHAVTLGTGAQ